MFTSHAGARSIVSLILALLGCAIAIQAQSASSLRGTVVDQQGASIAQAIVTLTNNGTGSSRQTQSDAAGSYQFLQMPPGEYTLSAAKPGFSTVTRKDVNLLVNTPASVDLKMEAWPDE